MMKRDFIGLTFECLGEDATRGGKRTREPPLKKRGGFYLRRETFDFPNRIERETFDYDALN